MVESPDLEALRQQLRALQQERDGLQRRLELLTQSSTSDGPNAASRTAELLWDAEKQLEALRTELATVRAERDGLSDDVAQIRAAKRTSDSGWRAEKQRLEELEKRLALYRSNMLQKAQGPSSSSSGGGTSSSVASPTAGATDRTTIELLLAKDSIVRLEGELAAARTTATAEQNMRMLAEQQLAAVRQQLADLSRSGLQVSATSCSSQEQQALVLSTVRAELLRAQVEAQQVKEQLQATRQQHEEQVAGLKRDIRNLHKELNERSAHAQDLELLVEQTSAALAVSQAAVKELQYVATYGGTSDLVRADSQQGALRELRLEVLQLQAQCKHYEAQCDQAAADKQQLQQQLEAALREADEAQSVVAKAQDHANQLKLQLAQAAREKVEVLLQLSAQLAMPPPPPAGAPRDPRLPLSSTASPRVSEDGSPSPCSPMLQSQASRRISSSSGSGKQPGGIQPVVVSSTPESCQSGAPAGLWQRMGLPRLLSGRGSGSGGAGGVAEHVVSSPSRSSDPGRPAPTTAPPSSSGVGDHTEAQLRCSPTAAAGGQPAAAWGAWVADDAMDVAGAASGCGSPVTPHPPPADTTLTGSGSLAGGREQVGATSMLSSSSSSSSADKGVSRSSTPCVVAAPAAAPKQHSKRAAAASPVLSPGKLHTAPVSMAPGPAASSRRPVGEHQGQPPPQQPPSVVAAAGGAAADVDPQGAASEEQQPSTAAAPGDHRGSALQQEKQTEYGGGVELYKEGYAPLPGLVQARRNMFGSQAQKGL